MEKEALCALPHGAHLFIAFSISFNLISLYIFPHWVRHESIPTIKITIAVLCQVHDACRTLTGSPSGLIIASWFEKTHSHFTFFFFFPSGIRTCMWCTQKKKYYDNCRFTCAHLYTYEFGTYADNAVCTYEARWNGYAHTHCDVSVCSQTLHSLIDFTIKLCSVSTH